MLKCNAPGCTTTENTQIDGKSLTLFSFPTYDDSLVKQWRENSKVCQTVDQNSPELKLCELHFESDSFASDEKNALAPGAVPTIFELDNKKRIADEKERDEEPPTKQTRLDNEEEPPNATNQPPKSPPVQSKPETVINDAENPKVEKISPRTPERVESNVTKKSRSSSVFTKQIDMGKKVYRLIIRIDKVISGKDQSKESKAVVPKEPEQLKQPKTSTVAKNGNTPRPCSKTGCKLTKTMLNSKPVFECERCGKYYIVKENKTEVNSNWTCHICKEVFPNPESLSFHVREHLVCDMCQAQCSTQISYDKHVMLHVSTDPLLPYKCHKCASTFEVKADVRQHYAEKHYKNQHKRENANVKKPTINSGQGLFRCEYCYAVFKREQAYKSHVNLHMGDGHFDCALCTKRFKTAKHLAAHQARHLGTFQFTCEICSKEFPSLDAVEMHMKTHMTNVVREEYTCNICKKSFNTESVLNSHMRGHLSRAHRCPICNKAFINKTTLRIHLKTHSKEAASNPTTNRDLAGMKRNTCTLCPSTFESRSRLYNHIMTHLEQIHGGEDEEDDGGDVVFDGINELLESEEDLLS